MSGLIIFVDSLRYEAPLSADLEAYGLVRRSYVPPLAYSANILPLLYRGKTPDEMGFFNEYGVSERDRARPLAQLDGVVEAIGRIPIMRKVIYRGLRTAGVDAANIPMRLLPYFCKQSTSTYSAGQEHPSVLEASGYHLVLANTVRAAPPERDRAALAEAARAVELHDRLYISLNDLDSISHEAGLGSPEYEAHERLLEDGIVGVIRSFRDRHGADAPVVVLSDHGMAPVHSTVELLVEERLGKPGRESYLYFLDSTLLRLWCYDAALRPRIESALDEWSGLGRRVTDAERQAWGIESLRTGDYLFVLHEGHVFEPNFIGRGVPRAMHGYHPDHTSQHAVFMSSRPDLVPDPELSGADAHRALLAHAAPGACTSAT